MTARKLNRRRSRATGRNPALPQRVPFIGPPVIYSGAPADVVERFADAVREWANQTLPAESSRCRGVESPGIGRANQEGGAMRRDRLRTTRTQDGRKVAVWQLAGISARILRAQFTSESLTAYRLPVHTPLPAAQPGTVMFDPYPDLAAARELLPEHGDLWDALRDDYWAALMNMEDLPNPLGE